jgi:tetratricopeptide (TPR) repeat protein
LYRANTTFKNRNFAEALKYFSILDSIDKDNIVVTHNLALLCQETGNYLRSAGYYEKLITQKAKAGVFYGTGEPL